MGSLQSLIQIALYLLLNPFIYLFIYLLALHLLLLSWLHSQWVRRLSRQDYTGLITDLQKCDKMRGGRGKGD